MTIHMIGQNPNAAPSRPESTERHSVDGQRDHDRHHQRDQRRPLSLEAQHTQQHEQHQQRQDREDRSQSQ